MDCERLCAEYGLDPREIVIAKLPVLKNLERCELSVIERRSAEIRFLNKYSGMPEVRRVEDKHQDDLDRLARMHGPPVLENAKSKHLGVVRLAFVSDEKALEPRPLPITLTVQKLADMAKRLLGVRHADRLQLDQNGFRIELDNPMRLLSFYDPQNGDTVRVL